MPAKEDVGVFTGATGGFAGGEANLWKFRDGACSLCMSLCCTHSLSHPHRHHPPCDSRACATRLVA